MITDPCDMAVAAYAHFDGLLGFTPPCECALELEALITPFNLDDLKAPFDAEIWNDVKHLPARKAPGPDGFIAEFLHACWPIVQQDFIAVFQQLYELRGRGFSCLNQALLTLLLKRADARDLGDYRPISLIHLVAKIFAKVLSLRLAPKLNALVSTSQNAFIPGRSLHDNFLLVQQSARLLHQLGMPRVLLKLDLTRTSDSISWPFLFDILRQYGFGARFLGWLAILLSSDSAKVIMNGKEARPFGTAKDYGKGAPCRSNSLFSWWTR